jgi:hypothetical protein
MRGISTCLCYYCMQYLTYIDDRQAGPISALVGAHEPFSPHMLRFPVGIPLVVTLSDTAAIG